MAAGIAAPYDRSGSETKDLVQNQWPARAGEQRQSDFGTSSFDYGVHVACHAGQSYQAPSKPAGASKRMGAFYEKTGVLSHRTEPGFKNTKGPCVLTEVQRPAELGTTGALGRTSGLPNAGSMVLSTPALRQSGAVNSRPDDVQSRRSRSSAASSQLSVPNSVAGSGGRQSTGSSLPSWAKRMQAQERQPWNFDPLPMYTKASDTYGKCHEQGILPQHIRAAGKSDSGFMDPSHLIETLTRPN